ncbi:MAG: EI24 domain-containing protein [Pseudomonadota bacterium]
MIIGDFLKALGQIGDARFRRVLGLGIGLTFALLFAIYAIFVTALGLFFPDTVSLPWIGEVTWVDNVISWASIPVMIVLSVFLMVPVASAFTGIFLEQVADAVEDRHYPHLADVPGTSLADGFRDSLAFLGILVVANIAAFALYLLFPPFAPFIFWGMNGFLLGREYFQLVAMRRLGRDRARKLRARHSLTIWLAGGLMAVPLTFPLINLFVPVLGAATFTHLFHRLEGTSAP